VGIVRVKSLSMYKAALIGLGKIAWKMGRDTATGYSLSHKDAYDQNGKVTLVAGFSPDSNEVDNFSNNCEVVGYSNLEQMLEQENPDIVSICSPHRFHAEQLELCYEHNIPMVWLEKPAAISSKEVELLEKRRKEKVPLPVVLVNFQRRYTDSYQNLKKLIEKKIYGEVLSVEINYSRGLMLNGSHMVDHLVYLFPESQFEVVWVEKGHKPGNPDFVVRLSDKLIAHFNGIDSTFHNIDVRITCEKARLSIEHGGMELRVEEVLENDLFPGFYRLYDKEVSQLGVPGFYHAFDQALEDLIESYENDKQPMSNLKTALNGQIIVENVLRESH
jgi:predicted dehydrogenase